jgi:chromosome segregation ATPase
MSKLNTEATQDMVNNVCNEFLRTGIEPTVSLVLTKLQDISSRSTAHKYYKKWTEDQNTKKDDLFKKLGFSSEFTSSFLDEINRFNRDAEQRYKSLAQDANEQRDYAISDLQNSESKVNKQTDVNEHQDKKIKDLQTELTIEKKANEVTVIEIRLQLTTSLNDNKQLTNQNESLRTGIAKAELKLESNQHLVDEVKSQNTYLTSENKELNLNVSELNRDIASKESTILGNDKLIATLEAEQEKTAKQISSFDSNNTKLQSEITSLRNELSIINTKFTEEKDKLVQQISINSELRANFEVQARTHEKTLHGYEATIAANDKLIIQLEMKHNL